LLPVKKCLQKHGGVPAKDNNNYTQQTQNGIAARAVSTKAKWRHHPDDMLATLQVSRQGNLMKRMNRN
jgi:hypothetical protein